MVVPCSELARWVYQRLADYHVGGLGSGYLKQLQAVPIVYAALSVKNSSETLKYIERNQVVMDNFEHSTVPGFLQWLKDNAVPSPPGLNRTYMLQTTRSTSKTPKKGGCAGSADMVCPPRRTTHMCAQ